MQRVTLISAFLSLAAFYSAGLADENTDRLSPPLTPIYVAPSPITSSTTYYPSAAAVNASPLTVAASTPPRWDTVANYLSGALDDLAQATSGAAEVRSPAAPMYANDSAGSPAAAATSSAWIENPATTASSPGLADIPAETAYGSKTTLYRPAAPLCGTCTKVYTPAPTGYNLAPAVYNSAGSAYYTPASSAYYVPASPAYYTPASSACCPTPSPAVAGKVVACRPVVEAASMPRDYYVGRGMIGQPVVYVPNQPMRNALRWFFP